MKGIATELELVGLERSLTIRCFDEDSEMHVIVNGEVFGLELSDAETVRDYLTQLIDNERKL